MNIKRIVKTDNILYREHLAYDQRSPAIRAYSKRNCVPLIEAKEAINKIEEEMRKED